MIQSFGGGLNLNVHFHTLVLDGVYAQSGGALVFHGAPPPSHREVGRVVVTVILRLLARRGFAPDVEAARDPLVEESPHSGKSECGVCPAGGSRWSSSVGGPTARRTCCSRRSSSWRSSRR